VEPDLEQRDRDRKETEEIKEWLRTHDIAEVIPCKPGDETPEELNEMRAAEEAEKERKERLDRGEDLGPGFFDTHDYSEFGGVERFLDLTNPIHRVGEQLRIEVSLTGLQWETPTFHPDGRIATWEWGPRSTLASVGTAHAIYSIEDEYEHNLFDDSDEHSKSNSEHHLGPLCVPPNLDQKLLDALLRIINIERLLAVAPQLIQTSDEASRFRQAVVDPMMKDITQRLEIAPGPKPDRDLIRRGPALYPQVLSAWVHGRVVSKDSRKFEIGKNENWRVTVTREIKKELPPELLIGDEDLAQLVERLKGLKTDDGLNGRSKKSGPNVLARDHTALLCGVPFYRYTPTHLRKILSRKHKRSSRL